MQILCLFINKMKNVIILYINLKITLKVNKEKGYN